jgi:multiple sugar transport system substrate-binding protein
MFKFKRIIFVLVALAMLVTACGAPPAAAPTAAPQPTAVPPTQPPAAQPVELRIAWWGSQARHDRTIAVIDLFQKKYPHIKITYEFAAWADYWTKMNTQAAGNNLPDVMQQDYQLIAQWVANKQLLPLDSYIADGTINLKNVAEASIKGGVLDGKNYAINLGNNTLCFELDVDAFKKAGIDLPGDKWTWDDYEKIAMAFREKASMYGGNDSLYNWELWRSVYLAMDQYIWSADGTQLGYDNDKIYADFLNMAVRLQKAKAIPTREEEVAAQWTLENNLFVKGQAAMTWLWTNQIVASWKAAGENRNVKIVTLPVPAGAKISAHYMKPSMFFSVAANSKHPKEAAMFIDFFTNSVEANEVLLAERGIPISSAVREGIKPKLGKSQVAMFDFAAQAEKTAAPIRPPDPAGSADISGSDNSFIVTKVIEPVMYGKLSAEDGVALLRKEATAILAKNKK